MDVNGKWTMFTHAFGMFVVSHPIARTKKHTSCLFFVHEHVAPSSLPRQKSPRVDDSDL